MPLKSMTKSFGPYFTVAMFNNFDHLNKGYCNYVISNQTSRVYFKANKE